MKLYIIDSTLNNKIVTFNGYNSFITYLEEMLLRRDKVNRKIKMNELASIGYGYDDSNSVTFVRYMAESINMGVIRENNLVKCDVPNIILYQKDEFGD